MKNQIRNAAPEAGIERMRQMYLLSFPGACLVGLFFLFFLQSAAVNGAVITVTGSGDTIAINGLSTLREAITSINNQADVNADVTLNRVGNYASLAGGTSDVINFNIGAGVQTIAPTGAEPTIVRPLTINGYSASGASANTLANADNAVILIRLDGPGAGAGVDGLTLGAGSGGSMIKGLDISNFAGNGIVIQSNGNFIVGNFIGVDPTGTARAPNGTFPNSGDGIRILNASNNQIGSTNAGDRNVVSGNALVGIHIVGTLGTPATGNIIQGNFVGVATDGVSSVGNRTEPAPAPGSAEGNNLFGIEISGGNLNTIGGTAAGARNVVGFNADGVEIDNGAHQNIIQGNFAGVGADGVTPTKNLLHGIALRSSNGFGAPLGPAQPNEPGVSFNLIGGTTAGTGNLVEFNGTAGIAVFGNPVSASGQTNIGNTIEGNSIFKNGRDYQTASSAPTPLLGIDLTNNFLFPRDDGLTPNDSQGHGAANDPNNLQNFPVLTSAMSQGGMTTIAGSLQSAANTTFRIEFFASDVDPLGLPAEGQQFLGFVNVSTDPSGNASFNVTLSVAVSNGRLVTATANDPFGNTSEFSAGVPAIFCDSNPPVIGMPNTINATARKKKVNHQKGAFVSFGVSAADPEDGPVSAIASPPSGSFFPIGTTSVQVTATDHCGNTSTTSFSVNVAKKKKHH
jgi:trimeric autotransporter adhesin